MNGEFQLPRKLSGFKLQAHLDGELSAKEAREIETQLASDNEAKALLSELQNTRAAFLMFEKELTLPESREFFWSKIEREIRALENKSERETAEPSWFAAAFLRRIAIPVGTFAAIALAAILTIKQTGMFSTKSPDLNGVEIAMADDSEAFTYHDHSAGMTVVWLSYPAEKEFTETDGQDTLQ